MQRALTADGARWRRWSSDEVAARNAGAQPIGSFGLVVGATIGSADQPGAPVDLAGSTVRSWRRGSARRVAPQPTSAVSSAPAAATCCPARRVRCCGTARMSARFAPAAEALIADFTFLRD